MDPAKFCAPSPSAIPTGRVVRAVLRNCFLAEAGRQKNRIRSGRRPAGATQPGGKKLAAASAGRGLSERTTPPLARGGGEASSAARQLFASWRRSGWPGGAVLFAYFLCPPTEKVGRVQGAAPAEKNFKRKNRPSADDRKPPCDQCQRTSVSLLKLLVEIRADPRAGVCHEPGALDVVAALLSAPPDGRILGA